MPEFKVKLGVKAKDAITGFEGIVTGRAQYITGCNQYVLAPRVKDGEYKTVHWFDENRLEVLNSNPVALPGRANTVDAGGPQSDPAPVK